MRIRVVSALRTTMNFYIAVNEYSTSIPSVTTFRTLQDIMEDQSPLVQALPPATDYMTYLTILGYNLDRDNLPLLHEILQDTELTSNIGWDLVELLLPLLPESKECMEDVARAGNPREVLLKVIEALRSIDFEDVEEEGGRDHDDSDMPVGTASKGEEAPSVQKFAVLLGMLQTLHARIKTKSPSRFLATTLEAMLSTLVETGRHAVPCILAALDFAEAIAKAQKPALPLRGGQAVDPSQLTRKPAVADPEAQNVEEPAEEKALQRGLLSLFVSQLTAIYLEALDTIGGPAMEWSLRQQEELQPKKIVPGRPTASGRYINDGNLKSRVDTIKRLRDLADLVGVTFEELSAAVHPPPESLDDENEDDDASPTTSLSPAGALYLIAANHSLNPAYPTHSSTLNIFPHHATLLSAFIGTPPAGGAPSAGTETPSTIDAILLFGLSILHNASTTSSTTPQDADSDDTFFNYMQLLTLLSANTASPTLRYHAHLLASAVLQAHANTNERWTFIKNTLQYCPYESLKASAVGWLKTELLESEDASADPARVVAQFSENVWPDLRGVYPTRGLGNALAEAWARFKANVPFYLAALNLAWLVCTTPRFDGLRSVVKGNTKAGFCQPLRAFVELLSKENVLSQLEDAASVERARAEVMLVTDALDRVSMTE